MSKPTHAPGAYDVVTDLTAKELKTFLARKFVDDTDLMRVKIGESVYVLGGKISIKTGSVTLFAHSESCDD